MYVLIEVVNTDMPMGDYVDKSMPIESFLRKHYHMYGSSYLYVNPLCDLSDDIINRRKKSGVT